MLVVDAMNVIGCRPDGWWARRDEALAQLLDDLRHAEVVAVLVADGAPVAGMPAGQYGTVELRYARRTGRDAADDDIAELVASLAEPATATVVTSDRGLSERVRPYGAVVVGAGSFRTRLDRRLDARPS